MNFKDLQNISKIYQEKVSTQLDEAFVDPESGETASGRTPLQNVSDHPKASVRKKAVGAFKKQMGKEYGGTWKSRSKDPVAEAAKPDYLDFDGDGNEKESMKKALKDKKKHKVDEANDGNLANNYPPYDKVTRGDVIAGALGKDQQGGKKKKVTKEGFSNWREDLSEIVEVIDKDKNDQKIVEKKVNNKIKINPNIGEAFENLGGTLLEMIEIDEVDFVVESVYDELLEEGYDEDDIEEAIEYALTEATITYGHDTDKPHQKKSGAGRLVKSVGRLARQKLSSKVRGAKRSVSSAAVSGLRNVAKGALGAARKIEGDKKPSKVHSKSGVRSASTYSGAGAGQRERVSSGSYTPPSKPASQKKAEPIQDPWEGSATTPSKKPTSKPQATTTTIPAPTSKKQRKKLYQDVLADVSGISDQERRNAATKRKKEKDVKEEYVYEKTLTSAETKEKERIVKSMKDKAADFEKRYPGRGKEVMYATATKMAKRIAENFIDEAKLPKSEKMGKKQRQSKTLKLTDCDDCTHDQRHPDAAKIHVVNPKGEKTHSLTPGEFAKHQLPSGHKYGFDEFRKTKIVKDTTKPNKRVVGYLNREDYSVIDERIRRYPEQRGVTARGSMDDNRGFTQDMKSRIGVKNLKAVHFVGDIKKGSGPEKKATVAKQIVSKRPDAKEVHFVDDHPGNVKAVTDTLAKPGKTVKGKVGRTRETGPKVKGFVAKPATKAKGTVKSGEVVPVRLGGEGREGNRGIRSDTSPSGSPKETQRRRKQQKMREAIETLSSKETPKEKLQNTSAINQVLQAKAKADTAEKDLAVKQKMASQKGVNLSSVSS